MGKVAEILYITRNSVHFGDLTLPKPIWKVAAMKQVMASRSYELVSSRKERAQLFIYDGIVTFPPEKSI